ncbi:MAG: hypothetical protein ACRD12_05170 [Acidimicrobiales bacterium]
MPGGDEVYEVGDQVGLAVQFGDEEHPFDPPQVVFRVRDPNGRGVDLTFGSDESVIRTAPGSYQVVIVATVAGRWQYRFVGMGSGGGGEYNGYFDVFDLGGDGTGP